MRRGQIILVLTTIASVASAVAVVLMVANHYLATPQAPEIDSPYRAQRATETGSSRVPAPRVPDTAEASTTDKPEAPPSPANSTGGENNAPTDESPADSIERQLKEAVAAAETDSSKRRVLRSLIEKAIEDHPDLQRILALTFEIISESRGLRYQDLSMGLVKGMHNRRKQPSHDADKDLEALLERVLTIRSARVWYLLGRIVAGAFSPNPPDALLAHMESMLLEGFEGDDDTASTAFGHTLTAYLVLTNDVERTLRIVGLTWNSSQPAWNGSRLFFMSVFLRNKFLSGSATQTDLTAALTFFPTYTKYTLANIERIPGHGNRTLEERREFEERLLAELWQILQPADETPVRDAIIALGQGPTSDADKALFERLLAGYDNFRAEFLAGNVEKPEWPPMGYQPWK